MIYNIYRNNISIAKVKPLDSSELSQQKQTEDLIKLDFEYNSYINLQVGDYIIFDKTGQKYFLNKLPTINEKGIFEYECEFEGSIHELSKTIVLLDKDFNFPLTGNAKTFLQFMVENLNRTGENYLAGDYIDTDDLTVEFVNWNVLEAINKLSELLSFDWYLEGKTLNFKLKNKQTPYVLNVGLKKGFLNLTRTTVENTSISTVVYGYGSTQNLPPRVADSGLTYNSPLLTENRLYFVGEDGESKLTNNIDKYGIREYILVDEDIMPERTGIITAIDLSDINSFYDSAIEFDINSQLQSGITPKIKFISGDLLGIEFNISFDFASKKITVDTFTDESGSYPNETLGFEIGDEYKLYDVIMPQSYIDDATTRLQEATQAYLDENSKNMVIYEGDIDKEWISANSVVLDIGDTVRVVSSSFQIDNYYEIKGLTQKITKPNEYSIQFGDVLPKSLINQLIQNQFNTDQSIYKVSSTQITNNQVTNIIGDEVSWQTL